MRKLAEYNFYEITKEDTKEILLYTNKIEAFFIDYRSTPGDLYFPPNETARNDATVKSIWQLSNQLSQMTLRTISQRN
jgi:hypothetical protein